MSLDGMSIGESGSARRSAVRLQVGAAAKRTIDLVGSVILIALFSPLMALVAAAIKLDSRGPVLFNQDRAGARRKVGAGHGGWEETTFRVHKFRSMYHEADESVHERYTSAFVDGTVEASAGERVKFKLSGDDRITRVGRLIRRTSIDELPQLFNVVKGEMSLVGPRPVPTYEIAQYEPWQRERLDALPGMTGYWQVYGRGVVSFQEMIEMDIYYVRNQSLWLDLQLLLRTIPAVVSGKGAG